MANSLGQSAGKLGLGHWPVESCRMNRRPRKGKRMELVTIATPVGGKLHFADGSTRSLPENKNRNGRNNNKLGARGA